MRLPSLEIIKQHSSFLGLALYWAWVTTVFYSDALVPTQTDTMLVEVIWLWATWSHMITLFICATLSNKIHDAICSRLFQLIGSIGLALGSALVPIILVFAPSGDQSQAFILADSIVIGICSAILVLQWGEAYAQGLGEATTILSMFSFVLGLVLYFVLLLFPSLITTAMAVLLPLLSGIALLISNSRNSESNQATTSQIDQDGTGNEVFGGLAVSTIAVFVFALCGEMLRVLALQVAGQSVVSMGSYYLLGGLIGLIVLTLIILLPKGSRQPDTARRITLPLVRNVLLFMAAAFLVAPFLGGYAITVSYGIFGAGFWCFRAISWIFCFMLVCQLRYSPIRVVAVLDGTFALSVVVSGQLNLWIAESIKVGSTELTTVSLVAVFVLMLMAIFVLNGKGVSNLLRQGFQQKIDTPCVVTDSESDIEAAVATMADRYGLSPRETEVAALLAKGRSLPFVQSELYISSGTAQTHARHIYKKLNVHSRQEFLDVTERIRRENQ